MRKKIKNSLSAKVFLLVFSVLTACGMLIYGIEMIVLPERYQFSYDSRLEANADALFADLEGQPYDEAVEQIYNFCIQNNSAGILSDGQTTLSFGGMESETANTATTSIFGIIHLADRPEEYVLSIMSISKTTNELFNLLLRLIPVILGAILLLSALSAFICSKVIVSPITEISQISKRMTALDMTWRCNVKSKDEIGVLASSLNTMASRLHETMEELTNANNQLTDDVEKFKAMEEQRRNFFAAVSHELKTPLTILKGQIENMILGYGDYQNRDKYLPEALKATEDIEYLVKEIIAISKMESMDLEDTLQEISLKQTVNYTVQTILPLAQDKNIHIHQNISTDMILSVNLNLWNKALSNIIGNAVRHSPCGENVFISVQFCENGNALIIENTGASIPEADIPHMFTPFYRADKSRNKATGGSGLGLYIVKTILDLHGMTCCIRNTQNGVDFEIQL